jgi:hypothetical protein
VRFIRGDLFETDFSEADVVTMYLLPDVNMKLREKILEMEPGTRVVSHAFDMQDWEPDQQSDASGQSVYMWVVPAQVAGTWEWQVGEGETARNYQVSLDQQFQEVSGSASVDGQPAELSDARLEGDQLSFSIRPDGGEPVDFQARFEDGQLVGQSGEGEQMAAGRSEWVAERTQEPTQG